MQPVHDRARRLAAVVLDVDGTLVDSNDAHARAWVDAFAEAGVAVDYERVRRAIGMGGDKLMPHVAGISDESPEGARITARRGEIFVSRYFPDVRPFPRVRELVQRFVDDGYTCVVASSANREELGPLLERANVADLITTTTSSDDADRSKPDPDIVRAAVERAGKSAHATVMLGDTPYDVEAALRAGIRIVGVECGGWTRRDLAGAFQTFAGPADLLDRYDQSIFSPTSAAATGLEPPGVPHPAIDLRVLGLIAAGVAGAALLLLAAQALRRRHSAGEQTGEDVTRWHRSRLNARDRERLRQLIARTS